MLLIISLHVKVQGFDKLFELVTLGIHTLKSVFADMVFIVELGNFIFAIKFEVRILVPFISSKSLEKIPLLLTFLWSWVLNSLVKVKWKG